MLEHERPEYQILARLYERGGYTRYEHDGSMPAAFQDLGCTSHFDWLEKRNFVEIEHYEVTVDTDPPRVQTTVWITLRGAELARHKGAVAPALYSAAMSATWMIQDLTQRQAETEKAVRDAKSMR